MVSILQFLQFNCSTCQKLGNSDVRQTGNFVEQQNRATKLLDFAVCLTWALDISGQYWL